MKGKLALLFSIIVLALIGVNIRLAYINKTNGEKYTKKVLAQQDTASTLLPYKRGDILDRNGTILATSEKVYNLILDPKVLLQNQDKDTRHQHKPAHTSHQDKDYHDIGIKHSQPVKIHRS